MVLKESCNFENLLHAKWSNFANAPKKITKFPRILGEDDKMIWSKVCDAGTRLVRILTSKVDPRTERIKEIITVENHNIGKQMKRTS